MTADNAKYTGSGRSRRRAAHIVCAGYIDKTAVAQVSSLVVICDLCIHIRQCSV